MNAVERLTSAEIVKASGASYRQVDHWARNGVLVPLITVADGSGSQRLYREKQAYVAAALVELSKVGVRGEPLMRAAEALTALPLDVWLDVVVVKPSGSLDPWCDRENLTAGWLLHLGRARRMVDRRQRAADLVSA